MSSMIRADNSHNPPTPLATAMDTNSDSHNTMTLNNKKAWEVCGYFWSLNENNSNNLNQFWANVTSEITKVATSLRLDIHPDDISWLNEREGRYIPFWSPQVKVDGTASNSGEKWCTDPIVAAVVVEVIEISAFGSFLRIWFLCEHAGKKWNRTVEGSGWGMEISQLMMDVGFKNSFLQDFRWNFFIQNWKWILFCKISDGIISFKSGNEYSDSVGITFYRS